MTRKIHLIGVSSHGLSEAQKNLLGQCRLIVGGKRLLALCDEFNVPLMGITPLASALSAIAKGLALGRVAVLASGDPLFFGIARRLLEQFGSEQVQIQPALSAMQEAASRFKLPWDDARLMSLHGRGHAHVAGLLLSHPKSFIFTDKANSPDRLAQKICLYLQLIEDISLLKNCRIMVAENIGSPTENLFAGTLQETANRLFADLNVMCLLRPALTPQAILGLKQEEIAHSRGLITKDEIRAVTLHRLRLPQKGVFWDVGAGSGSISIEAARMNPALTVFAIERKEEELANIRMNIRRFACYNVIPVAGHALDVLPDLPDPQRVFIGGNGGQLKGIITESSMRLGNGGYLVVNGVIEKTIRQAPVFMAEQGLVVKESSINITRTGQNGEALTLNPITIMAGIKVQTS